MREVENSGRVMRSAASLSLLVASLFLTGCAFGAGAQLTPPPCLVSVKPPCGGHTVEVHRLMRTDTERNREIPITVYLPSTANGRSPMILFSPGLGNSNEGYRYLGRYWASHGFAAVHVGHRGTDERAVNRSSSMRVVLSFFDRRQWRRRVGDLAWVHRHGLSGTPLEGRIDTSRIGVAGHSYGALTVVRWLAVEDEPSIAAALLISPPRLGRFFATDQLESIRLPVLHVVGSDESAFAIGGDPDDPGSFFHQMINATQYLIVVDGASHATFSDDLREPDALHPERIAIIQAATLRFFESALRENRAVAPDELLRLTDGIGSVVTKPANR